MDPVRSEWCAKMIVAKISVDVSEQNRSSKLNGKGTSPMPYNQWIENGWASGIQEPTNNKNQAGVIVVKESCVRRLDGSHRLWIAECANIGDKNFRKKAEKSGVKSEFIEDCVRNLLKLE